MTNHSGWDPVWESIYRSQDWGKYPPEDLVRFVAKNFYGAKNRKEVKILEVGCGPGANLWYIAREGFSCYGIDGSTTAVEKCISRFNEEVPHWSGEVKVGDIQFLPFSDNYFDAVIDVEAIYANSFEKSKEIIKEIRRTLKPEGKFFSKTFATGSYGDGLGEKSGHNAYNGSQEDCQHKSFTRFTSKDDIGLLLAGFRLDELNLLQRTIGGYDSGKTLKEWLIWATKN